MLTSQSPITAEWDASPSMSQLFIAVVTGAAVGAAISAVGQPDMTQDLAVWAAVATGLTTAAGVSAANGWVSWRALRGTGSNRVSREVLFVASAVTLAVLLGLAGYMLPTGQPSNRGALLIAVAIIGGVPALLAIGAIQGRVTSIDTSRGAAGVDALGVLRVVLVRQLRGLGSLVALATLALAISPALGSMFEGPGDGNGVVLVLGGAGSALVALAFVPVAVALRNRVAALARQLYPVGADDDGQAVHDRLRGRQDLVRLVMGERGIYDELLASLVVAGPLITAAIGRVVA